MKTVLRWQFLSQAFFLASVASTAPATPAVYAPALLLAETEKGQTDISLYLVSEKLDGVRAFWDGETLRSRSGQIIHAPSWFVEQFPAQPLDGELWMGRGQFDRLSAAVRKKTPVDAEWRQVRYLVFELPGAPGSFRERVHAMRKIASDSGVSWLEPVAQWEIRDRKALQKTFEALIKAGGEGLMLHRVDAPYTTGRSDILLKMKAWHDAEATVVGHQPGKGKFLGLLGALRVRTPEGREFMLGTGLSDTIRRNPPPIGTIVTYRYRELTGRGLPRFASFHRLRDNDL